MGKRVWEEEDVVALWAWLDFCNKHHVNFDGSIVTELENAKKYSTREQSINIDQIWQKMRKMAREHGSFTDLSLDGIKRRGSKGISHIREEFANNVRIRLELYEQRHTFRLQNKGRQQKVPGLDHVGSSKYRPQVSQSNSKGSVKPQQIFELPNHIPKALPRAGGSLSQPQLHPRKTTKLAANDIQKQARVEQDGARVNKMNKQQQREDSMQEKPVDTRISPGEPSHRDVIKKYKNEIQRKDMEMTSIRREWQDEARELLKQQARSIQIEQDLRAQIRHWETASKQVEASGRDPLHGILFSYIQQQRELTKRVQDMKQLLSFCQRTPQQVKEKTQKLMDEAMGTIAFELESVIHSHDINVPLHCPLIQPATDLGGLVRTLSGGNVGPGQETAHLRRIMAKFGSEPGYIIRCLISAALRDWVFSTDFPNFDKRGSRVPDAYRAVILKYDGWESLHNIELAAYHSVMDDAEFKERDVTRKAEQLAIRLSKTLAPLFFGHTEETLTEEFARWGQTYELSKSRKFRLIGAFRTALDLKAKTVITDHTFAFEVFEPGMLESLGIGSTGMQALEKFELLGSMYMYNMATSYPRDLLKDSMVLTNNFDGNRPQNGRENAIHSSLLKISRKDPANEMEFAGSDPNREPVLPEQTRVEPNLPEAPPIAQHSLRDRAGVSNLNSNELSSLQPTQPENSSVGEAQSLSNASRNVLSSKKSRLEKSSSQTKCPMCSMILTDAGLKSHLSNRVCGRCSECGEICRGHYSFKAHHKRRHPGLEDVQLERASSKDIGDFECRHCNKSFPSKQNLIKHNTQSHRISGQHRADVSEITSSQDTDVDHAQPQSKSNTGGTEITCPDCERDFVHAFYLEMHLTKEHRNKCKVCGMVYQDLMTYRTHLNAQHSANTDLENGGTHSIQNLVTIQIGKPAMGSQQSANEPHCNSEDLREIARCQNAEAPRLEAGNHADCGCDEEIAPSTESLANSVHEGNKSSFRSMSFAQVNSDDYLSAQKRNSDFDRQDMPKRRRFSNSSAGTRSNYRENQVSGMTYSRRNANEYVLN